jgi:hypothetical protein
MRIVLILLFSRPLTPVLHHQRKPILVRRVDGKGKLASFPLEVNQFSYSAGISNKKEKLPACGDSQKERSISGLRGFARRMSILQYNTLSIPSPAGMGG